MLFEEIIGELGVPGVTLRLSSLGSPESRAAYREELVSYLRTHESRLAGDVRERIDANPMRAFDSKDEGTREVMAGAPRLLERLDADDAEHFDAVRGLLDANGVSYEIDDTLVRGLDYYTRTVFEIDCAHLGAQSQIGGGGRYDGLVEQLGGPATPAAGWAAGIERILLAMGADAEVSAEPRDAFVAATADEQRRRALALVAELRNAGLSVELDLAARGLKGQLKQADRLGARATVILEEDGSAQLRDMETGEQRAVEPGQLIEELGRNRS
jgi:histidyl-tRNA synthetase